MVDNRLYILRASPAVGVGGMYATGNGAFKIVTVAAQVPDTFVLRTVSFYILGVLNTDANALPLLVEDHHRSWQERHIHYPLVPQARRLRGR